MGQRKKGNKFFRWMKMSDLPDYRESNRVNQINTTISDQRQLPPTAGTTTPPPTLFQPPTKPSSPHLNHSTQSTPSPKSIISKNDIDKSSKLNNLTFSNENASINRYIDPATTVITESSSINAINSAITAVRVKQLNGHQCFTQNNLKLNDSVIKLSPVILSTIEIQTIKEIPINNNSTNALSLSQSPLLSTKQFIQQDTNPESPTTTTTTTAVPTTTNTNTAKSTTNDRIKKSILRQSFFQNTCHDKISEIVKSDVENLTDNLQQNINNLNKNSLINFNKTITTKELSSSPSATPPPPTVDNINITSDSAAAEKDNYKISKNKKPPHSQLIETQRKKTNQQSNSATEVEKTISCRFYECILPTTCITVRNESLEPPDSRNISKTPSSVHLDLRRKSSNLSRRKSLINNNNNKQQQKQLSKKQYILGVMDRSVDSIGDCSLDVDAESTDFSDTSGSLNLCTPLSGKDFTREFTSRIHERCEIGQITCQKATTILDPTSGKITTILSSTSTTTNNTSSSGGSATLLDHHHYQQQKPQHNLHFQPQQQLQYSQITSPTSPAKKPSYLNLACCVNGYSNLTTYDSKLRQNINKSREVSPIRPIIHTLQYNRSADGGQYLVVPISVPLANANDHTIMASSNTTKSSSSSSSNVSASIIQGVGTTATTTTTSLISPNKRYLIPSSQKYQQYISPQKSSHDMMNGGNNGNSSNGKDCTDFVKINGNSNGYSLNDDCLTTPTKKQHDNTEHNQSPKSFIQQRVERLYGPSALAAGFYSPKRSNNDTTILSERSQNSINTTATTMHKKLLKTTDYRNCSNGSGGNTEPTPIETENINNFDRRRASGDNNHISTIYRQSPILSPSSTQNQDEQSLPVLRHLRPEFRAQLPILSPKRTVASTISPNIAFNGGKLTKIDNNGATDYQPQSSYQQNRSHFITTTTTTADVITTSSSKQQMQNRSISKQSPSLINSNGVNGSSNSNNITPAAVVVASSLSGAAVATVGGVTSSSSLAYSSASNNIDGAAISFEETVVNSSVNKMKICDENVVVEVLVDHSSNGLPIIKPDVVPIPLGQKLNGSTVTANGISSAITTNGNSTKSIIVNNNKTNVIVASVLPVCSNNDQDDNNITTNNSSSKSSSSTIKDGIYFLNILTNERDRLIALAVTAEKSLEILVENPDADEDVIGHLRSAAGKARLLATQKIRQFEGLCHNSLNQVPGEKFPTTAEDLQGFWDMVMLQVDHVDSLFKELEILKSNNWKKIPIEENRNNPPQGSRLTKRPTGSSRTSSTTNGGTKTTTTTTTSASSNNAAAVAKRSAAALAAAQKREAQRKQLLELKRKNKKTQELTDQQDAVAIIDGPSTTTIVPASVVSIDAAAAGVEILVNNATS